jgi:PAS domain S-box
MNTNDYHVYRVEGVPMRNEYDEIIEYGIMKSDITENVNLIKDNEESHHLLTSILESLPAMVFIKDIDNEFRFVIANASFVTFFTGEKKNIVGLKESEFATPEMEQVCRKSDLEAIQYTIENPLTQIETFPHADGTFSYLQSIKFASKIHGRNLLICAALDVTELQTAKSKAENSDRLKSAFLANISHEIRTPLNAIVGFSDLLMTTDDPAEKERFCQIIHANNEKLLMLISDIIDLSKIDSGSMSFVKDNFDVNDLMGDVLRLYEQKMDQTSIDFQVIKNNVPFVINQDKDHILEVLRNFINNAIKYTSEGFIKVWYEQENNGVKFYVKDTGIGISPVELREGVPTF